MGFFGVLDGALRGWREFRALYRNRGVFLSRGIRATPSSSLAISTNHSGIDLF
jgi:hypothetical protein